MRDLTAAERGHLLRQTGDLSGAVRAYREAAVSCPSAENRAFLGAALILAGEMAEGFRTYDAAWRGLPGKNPAPELPFPRWRGEDVAGKRFLIWSEEGFGDQIMFARFARELAGRGARVGWVCPPALARLFNECLGVTAIGAAGQNLTLGEFEFYCPSSALPAGFELSPASIPAAPYLKPPPAVSRPGCRIGVAWRGNPKQASDALRSLPGDLAARLLALPGAVSLHPEDTGARDFYDTASIMAGLDLVISVDSAPAHLAGALGVPVWVLVRDERVDWRWLGRGGSSLWYQSARVFRQDAPGDWSTVLDRVVAALELGEEDQNAPVAPGAIRRG